MKAKAKWQESAEQEKNENNLKIYNKEKAKEKWRESAKKKEKKHIKEKAKEKWRRNEKTKKNLMNEKRKRDVEEGAGQETETPSGKPSPMTSRW